MSDTESGLWILKPKAHEEPKAADTVEFNLTNRGAEDHHAQILKYTDPDNNFDAARSAMMAGPWSAREAVITPRITSRG